MQVEHPPQQEPAQQEPAQPALQEQPQHPLFADQQNHPHAEDESYQKWLRRQETRTKNIINISEDAGDEASEGPSKCAEESGAAETESGEGASPHQNEEWYQKWLRRQKNRARQIIEIGVEKPEDPEPTHQESQSEEWQSQPAASSDDGKKSYETEEWYQKWLRRQEHRPRKIIYIGGDQPQQEEEKQEESESAPQESETEVQHQPQEERKSYENEEWYQKWLRRQKNKNRQIIEIGVDKPKEPEPQSQEPDSGGPDDTNGWAEEQHETQESQQAHEETHTAEPEKKSYENEEWYQKWLRRQANKNRQIITIG